MSLYPTFGSLDQEGINPHFISVALLGLFLEITGIIDPGATLYEGLRLVILFDVLYLLCKCLTLEKLYLPHIESL